jgi:hypothetical protein
MKKTLLIIGIINLFFIALLSALLICSYTANLTLQNDYSTLQLDFQQYHDLAENAVNSLFEADMRGEIKLNQEVIDTLNYIIR